MSDEQTIEIEVAIIVDQDITGEKGYERIRHSMEDSLRAEGWRLARAYSGVLDVQTVATWTAKDRAETES